MKRVLILIMAALLTMTVAVPATASTDSTLEELLRLRDEAQGEVNRLTGVVEGLEEALEDAETVLKGAQDDLAEAIEARDEAEAALTTAKDDLEAATDALDTILGIIQATTNPQGDCVGNPTQRASCAAAKANLPGAQQDVSDAEEAVEEAASDLDAAREAVEEAEEALEAAEGDRDDAFQALNEAKVELAEAQEALAAAQEALDSYVPPPPADEDVRHAGCKGIENAQAKSANSKGKSAQALQDVSGKLGCS